MFFKLFQKIHPSFILIGFFLGIVAGDILIHIFRYTFFASVLWLFVAILVLVFSLIFPRPIFLVSAFLAGLILISFRATPDFSASKTFESLIGREVEISATIIKDPNVSDDKTALTLSDLEIFPETGTVTGSARGAKSKAAVSQDLAPSASGPVTVKVVGKIYASLPGNPKTEKPLRRSDRIVLKGKLSAGFGTYLASMYRPEIIKVSRAEPGDFFLNLRDGFADKVQEKIPGKEAGLALGYLLGMRGGVDKDFEEALRTVGLTHIIVASGTHLSILASFAKKLFGRLSRFAGFFGATGFIVIFVGITGFTPSMSRAAPVALLGLLAWYLGRDRSPARILLAVMAGTLIWNPTNLLDLAWLLSFASFTGIMIFSPLLSSFFYGAKKPGYLAELIFSSLSATLLCAPILIYFYGSISLISIFANLLILPTISAVMGLTFLTGALNLALAPLSEASAYLAKILLDYHFAIVSFLGEQKYFLINLGAGDVRVFLCYIPIAIISCVAFIRGRSRRSRTVVAHQ